MKSIFLFSSLMISIFITTNSLLAQWQNTNGPDAGAIHSLAVNGTNLFAATDVGVFFSTNNGTSWTAGTTGMTNTSVRSLAVFGANLFAGTFGGVYLSTDNGRSWTVVNSGLQALVFGEYTYPAIYAFAMSGSNLFSGVSTLALAAFSFQRIMARVGRKSILD